MTTPARTRKAFAFTLSTALLGGLFATLPVTAAAADETPLITTAATDWQYLDSGVDPAGSGEVFAWAAPAFDDSEWKTARGSFGALRGAQVPVSGNAVNTLLTQYKAGTSTNIETFFFRSGFDLTAEQLDDTARLTGSVTFDDALAVWVNGTKVAGFLDDAFDPAKGNMQYLGASNGAPITRTVTVDAETLVAGENTIAVALYQDRDTSSDIYFDFTSLEPVSANAPIQVSDLILNVGTDESERGVAWYSNDPAAGRVEFAPAAAMTGAEFPVASATTAASTSGTASDGQTWHHATIAGLAENSEYVYRVGNDRGWSEVNTFSTAAFDGDFDFLYVGDAQIGASGNTANDTAGWVNTMNVADDMFPASEFLLSGGDQVEHAANEEQYDGFLKPEQLTSIPVATVNGNHDVGSTAYSTHFNMPNLDTTYGSAANASQSGGNHWFIHKGVLVIGLNSNNRDNARHAEYVEKIVAEQGHNATWRVVTFHHSIYSVANHSLSADIVERREQLSPVLSANDIDLVLMGHDHVYTRSHLMDGATPLTENGVTGEVFPEKGHVLYLTGNSSSGSKYYSIRPNEFPFAAVPIQERIPSFMNIEVTDDALTATTYRTTDRGVVDRVVLHQVAEEPGTEEPGTEEPGTEEPGTEEPGTEEPGTEEPGTEEPGTEEPGTEEPGTEEPGTEQPGTEQPGTEQPGTVIPAPVDSDQLPAALRTLTISGVDRAAGTVSVRVSDELIGEPVTFYVYSAPQRLAAIVPGASGAVTLTMPTDLAAGEHRIAAYTADGAVAQWNEFTWAALPGAGAGTDAAGAPALAATGLASGAGLGMGILALLAGVVAVVVTRRRTAVR